MLTALRLEALAVGGADVIIGAGAARARRAGAELAARLDERTAVALVGVAGGLSPKLHPGDLVLPSELRCTDSTEARPLLATRFLAGEFARAGIGVHTGPLVSSPRYVRAREREALAASGAVAVDMESAWVMGLLASHPLAVIRSISDTTDCGRVRGGPRALGSLHGVRRPLERWARACGEHEVVLAAPRSFCAGVERAIEIVERALELNGPPVYVRRQIVHNLHVVSDLESRGAVFVNELEEVPEGALVVLAAHGVAPVVRRQAAARRDLRVVDATCPLVAKVHTEARRYAGQGFDLVLIGHPEHEEVIGTLGEAPEHFSVVESVDDVARLEPPGGGARPLVYLTQTTLATDETAEIVAALRRRFPGIVAPPADDICYATQNRQDAVRRIAHRCDLMLVVGSSNSSNTARLVEVAEREGCRAELIEDVSQLQLSWLAGATSIGLTAGASAPDALVQEVVETLRSLGPLRLSEERTAEENVRFALPTQVR